MEVSRGRERSPDRLPAILSGGVFLGGLVIFLLIAFRTTSDFDGQAAFLVDCIENRFLPAAFLFYLAVALVTLFSTNIEVILVGFAAVLAVAVAAKFRFSAKAAVESLAPELAGDRKAYLMTLLGCVGLVFLFCIPFRGQNWYLGQFPPNIWHNPTTIALMPFGVLLFLYSVDFLRGGDPRRLRGMMLLVVLNLLTKPSLFFCYAVVFPLFSLIRFGPRKRFVQACLVVALGCGVMFLQYLLIYHSAEYNRISESEGTTLALGWLHVWGEFSRNIPLSILNSLLLPGLFMLAYPRAFFSDDTIRFALALLVVGLSVSALIYETGPREFHGTYSFQNIATNYLLHLGVMIAFMRQKLRDRTFGLRDYALFAVFQLQIVLGFLYVIHYIRTGSYV